MSYDRMGRRVTKNDQRFIYDGYLQIANFELSTSNFELQTFIWDPTEPIATRPLVWVQCDELNFYIHDGNKNVSEVVAVNGDVAAHYEYAPFGALSALCGNLACFNHCRFSSEFSDDTLEIVYYNYRHLDSVKGRWLSRDCYQTQSEINLYLFLNNGSPGFVDLLGQRLVPTMDTRIAEALENEFRMCCPELHDRNPRTRYTAPESAQ